MPNERIKQRAEGRAAARLVLGLVELPNDNAKAAFLDELKDLLTPVKTDAEKHKIRVDARRAGAYQITFGAHSGQTLSEIPREYLDWLVGATEDTLEALKTYLDLTKE